MGVVSIALPNFEEVLLKKNLNLSEKNYIILKNYIRNLFTSNIFLKHYNFLCFLK
jgi:hypothetical protein